MEIEQINFLVTMLKYMMYFGALIAVAVGLKMIHMSRSFFPVFEERYHLNNISSYGPSRDDLDNKLEILINLSRYYVSPYWTAKRRKTNEDTIKKYEKRQDPYFLACEALLNEKYFLKKSSDKSYASKSVDASQNFINEDDLKKFLNYDRCITTFMVVGVITAALGLFYKFGIPYLFVYLQ